MTENQNKFDLTPVQEKQPSVMGNREASAAAQEVQAGLVIAQKCPRDENAAYNRILNSCKRIGLAERALYSFPRGKTTIEGPSINLAKAMAQKWGNLEYGIRELSNENGVSEMEAYCWDYECNVKERRVFFVKHVREAYGKQVQLKSERDIYEMTANMGSRRLRACILGIIPEDITDAAVAQINLTLRGDGSKPFVDRVRDMFTMFDELGVTKQMIEKRLTHKSDAISPQELVGLGKIYKSIKDGFSGREDWFEVKTDLSHLKNDKDKEDAPAPPVSSDSGKVNDKPKTSSKTKILAQWQDLCDEYGQVAHDAMGKLGFKTVETDKQISQITDMCLSLSDN